MGWQSVRLSIRKLTYENDITSYETVRSQRNPTYDHNLNLTEQFCA